MNLRLKSTEISLMPQFVLLYEYQINVLKVKLPFFFLDTELWAIMNEVAFF